MANGDEVLDPSDPATPEPISSSDHHGAPAGGRPSSGADPAQIVTAMDVIATVSHELRSPLTSIKGYTALLLNRWDRLDDDRKQEMLGQVQRDADRVTRLITELLDISRLETGRLSLRREMAHLSELAAAAVETVGMAYPDLQAELRFPPDLPEVWVDTDKVLQVLTNLVENAAKYGDPVGLVIEGRVVDEELVTSVVDRGPGIPASDLPRVFDQFFQRNQGRPSGTGLGLWISRGLVEAHGGRLTARSDEGEGAAFSFSVPLGAFDAVHGPG